MFRRLCVPILALLALSAGCSSGGSRPPPAAPLPPVAEPPAPPPPPSSPPPPPNFRTAEYNRNAGLEQINVVPAYETGATGAGVVVSVIDSGIDLGNPEFAGRIDPRSADLVVAGVVPSGEARPGDGDLQSVDGHGVAVAGIIAAAKNNTGMHGVAFDSTLLIYRVDGKDDPEELVGAAIVEGVQRSASAGVGVLNMSFASDDDDARENFRTILQYTAEAGILTALAAGNDGAADPEGSALAAADPQAGGAAIIVGAVNSSNQIASFSNRAGEGADFFLVAPGVQIATTEIGGGVLAFSGTSASTAFVSGAAALLRQRWPQLSAAEVVDILLVSATDLGAPGTDAVYGRGMLNVGAAMQPIGGASTASVSGASLPVAGMALALGPAFGAGLPDLGEFVFLDGYSRDFRASLNAFLQPEPDLRLDPAAILRPQTRFAMAQAPLAGGSAFFRLRSDDLELADAAAAARSPSWTGDLREGERDERLSAAFAHRLSDRAETIVSHGFAPREIDDMLIGATAPRLIARDGFADAFLPQQNNAFAGAMRWRVGDASALDFLVAYADEARFDAPFIGADLVAAPARTTMRAGFSTLLPGGSLRLETGIAQEENGLLGSVVGGPLGRGQQSAVRYHAAQIDIALMGGWRGSARGAVGFVSTGADGAEGFLSGVDNLTATQFAASAWRNDFLTPGDRFSLTVSQPLRVESGRLRLTIPEAYDIEARALVFADRQVALGGAPREVDIEIGYGFATPLGWIDVNLLRQMNATSEGGATAGLLRSQVRF